MAKEQNIIMTRTSMFNESFRIDLNPDSTLELYKYPNPVDKIFRRGTISYRSTESFTTDAKSAIRPVRFSIRCDFIYFKWRNYFTKPELRVKFDKSKVF